jgi:S1-C subfamily serine protease
VDEVDDTCHLIAADAEGRVYPVREVVAADPEADTCLLRIEAQGLVPLPLRPGARPGERVYCLSHPAGNHFMFTEGMVARICRIRDLTADFTGPTTTATRPILCLNITAEFSPGSSGGPVVDESGNVLAQVQSLAPDSATEDSTSTNLTILSGTIRYCIAAEEIVPLFKCPPGYLQPPLLPPVTAPEKRPAPKLEKTR